MAARAETAQGRDHRRAGRAARRRLRGAEAELAQRFVRAYFRNVAPEDLAERDPLDLYGAALAQLRFGQEREPGAGQACGSTIPKSSSTAGSRRIRSSRSSTTTCRSWSTASTIELNRHAPGHPSDHPSGAGGAARRRRADCWIWALAGRGAQTRDARASCTSRSTGRAIPSGSPRWRRTAPRAGRRPPRGRRLAADARARSREVAGRARVGAAAGAGPRARRRRARSCAGWPTTISRCSATAPTRSRTVDGVAAACASSGSGLGILRSQRRWRRRRRASRRCRRRSRARARCLRQLLTITKANTRSTVHRAELSRFRRRQALRRRRHGDRRASLSRPVHLDRLQHEPARRSRCSTARCERDRRARRLSADRACRQGAAPHPGDLSARRAAPDRRGRAVRASPSASCTCRIGSGCACSCAATRSAASCPASSSCPRDRYNTAMRERMQQLLRAGGRRHRERIPGAAVGIRRWRGSCSSLRTRRMACRPISISPTSSGVWSSSSRSWTDRLRDALLDACGEERGNRLFDRLWPRLSRPPTRSGSTPARPCPTSQPSTALRAAGADDLAMTLYRRLEDPAELLRFKLIRRDLPVLLSDALPVLENMGLRVLTEEPSQIARPTGAALAARFRPAADRGGPVDVDAVRESFQDLFRRSLDRPARERRVQPAGARGRAQPTPDRHPARLLPLHPADRHAVQPSLYRADPERQSRPSRAIWRHCSTPASIRRRTSSSEELQAGAGGAASSSSSNDVASLDQDRILRRYLELIKATLAHQLPGSPTRTGRAQGLRLATSSTQRGSRRCRRRGRCSRSSSMRPMSRACICAAARSRAAACAGPIGARISAPRSWA